MRLEERLAAALSDRALTLATAESCTGGGLSHLLTEIPGASAFFIGGVIAYHNDVKSQLLEVPRETLTLYGAVSSQTAAAMAEGSRSRFKTDFGVSITGIAGPTGGSAEKPVGLVYIAVAGPQRTHVEEHRFPGDRSQVRDQAITAAMRLILGALTEET
ncbi:CinA family protein [Candidatus Bipolaricaulota bacterium]|nr:CinA family protein [Candidatus Bipolaricaulota bacterium]